MTARTPPVSTAVMEPLASYCVNPAGCKTLCPSCEHNQWIDDHTCRWCSSLNVRSEDGHHTDHGHFCGPTDNSLCKHLFFEWLSGRKVA